MKAYQVQIETWASLALSESAPAKLLTVTVSAEGVEHAQELAWEHVFSSTKLILGNVTSIRRVES